MKLSALSLAGCCQGSALAWPRVLRLGRFEPICELRLTLKMEIKLGHIWEYSDIYLEDENQVWGFGDKCFPDGSSPWAHSSPRFPSPPQPKINHEAELSVSSGNKWTAPARFLHCLHLRTWIYDHFRASVFMQTALSPTQLPHLMRDSPLYAVNVFYYFWLIRKVLWANGSRE